MKAVPFVRGLNFGEGLRWRDGRLWYSDFYQHTVTSVDESGEKRIELKIDDQPSGLGWLPDGRLLVVAMRSQRLLRREKDGSIALHADLKPHAKFHANDMLVDARGNAFIACFGFDLDHFIAEKGVDALWGEPGVPTAPILHVSPEGKVRVASPDHKFPNGMVLTGNTLIAAETFMPGFTAFDLDADGTLSNRRVWGALPKNPPAVVPDGISIDREGAIWAANAVAAEVVRVGPGGKILERVETSQPAFACALGGKNGQQLFIATSGSANTEAATKEPRGLIEIATVNVPAP